MHKSSKIVGLQKSENLREPFTSRKICSQVNDNFYQKQSEIYYVSHNVNNIANVL